MIHFHGPEQLVSQDVPAPVFCMNRKIVSELFLEIGYMHAYGIVQNASVSLTSPDVPDKFFPIHNNSSVFDERLQYYLFCPGEMNPSLSDCYFPISCIEAYGFVPEYLPVAESFGTSEQCMHSREQLVRKEGFYDIIVRTDIESGDPIFHIGVSGNHDNGSGAFLFLSEPLDNIQPASVPERKVYDVELRFRIAVFHKILVSEKRTGSKAVVPEFFRYLFREKLLVVYYGYMHIPTVMVFKRIEECMYEYVRE